MEAGHTRAALKSMRNKTDRNDARGLAQILRTGWFQPVYIKSDEAYRMRLLLTARRNLKRKFLDLENAVRHSLKAFGIRLGHVARKDFERKVREHLQDDPVMTSMVEGLLTARAVLWKEHLKLHNLIVRVVGRDELMRRFTSVPGVGPITAMSFRAAVDDPNRFQKSRIVGAHFGLTPRRYQSGTSVDYGGRISKLGDENVRHALYEAANALLTLKRGKDPLKSWGQKIAKKRGHKAACCAVARKIAIILHAMWRDGTAYGAPKKAPHLLQIAA
jgi:transposase